LGGLPATLSGMTASCLMVQGTASGVGKSLLTAAFCRIFSRQGYRVAPFKAQNMALNAAVTADGCEIGRAQAAQAEAAGVEPTVDMNPILLKPEGEDCSQVVVRGRPIGRLTFREYGAQRGALLAVVAESLARLRAAHDLVNLDDGASASISAGLGIVVVRPPRIANFDGVEPLAREPGVRVRFATSPSHLVGADLLIVPGSKSTIADLAWLRESRLADAL